MGRFAVFASIHAAARRLRAARAGSATTLLAFAAPVVIGSLAISIDTGIWYMEKRKTQQMADGASLGAMRAIRNGDPVEAAEEVAVNDAVRNGYVEGGSSTLTVNSPPLSGPYEGQSNAVEVVITRELPLMFSRYFFTSEKTVSARSVSYSPAVLGKNLEVAMMLDVSASMGGNSDVPGVSKLKAMQDAAKSLVETVIQSSQTPYSSRVSLVPYSSAVNVGTDSVGGNTVFKLVTNKTISGSWTSVVERGGDQAFTDAPPATGMWFHDFKTRKAYAMGAYASTVQNMSSNTPSSGSKIRPLSTDKTSLKSTIGNFSASGTTAGHVGTAWSWYLLSPNWSSIWTGSKTPGAYNASLTNKAVVLLSDFDMNSYYVSGNGVSSLQTQTLCDNMKTAGITIYTVGYNVDPAIPAAVDLWNNCATDSEKVFSANSVSELLAAFQAIAQATVTGAMTTDIRLGE